MAGQTKLRSSLLWRFLLLALLPIVILGVFTFYFVTKETTENLETKNLLLAASLASEVQESLREPQTVLRQMAAVLRDYFTPKDPVAPQDPATNYLLDSAVRNSSYFESIYLVNRQGALLHAGLPEAMSGRHRDYDGLDLSQLPAFQQALKSKDLVWSDLLLSPVVNRPSLSLVYPYGRLLLVGNLNVEYLGRLSSRQQKGPKVNFFILDKTGTLIVHADPLEGVPRANLSQLLPVKEGLAGHQGTWRFFWQGREQLGSVARVPATGWLVLVTQDVNVAYAASRQIRNSFLFGFGLVLLLALMAAIAFSRRLVQPLHELAAQAQEIATGEYKVNLPPQSHQEMENLAASFRSMASEIDLREEALRRGQEHYLRLFNSGNDAVFVNGFDADGLPGHYLEVNDIACVFLGYQRHELLALKPQDICSLFRDDPDAARDLINKGRSVGHVLFESELTTRGGRCIPFEFNVHVFDRAGEEMCLAVARDISERRAVETALRQSEQEHRLFSQQFQALFDGIPDGLVLYDDDFRVLWANRGAGNALHLPEDRLVGQVCYEAIHGHKEPCDDCVVRRAFDSGEPQFAQKERSDGTILELRGIPIHDEDGAVVRVIEFAQDVTEKIRIQKEIIRTGQLAAIGELAAGVAHEINNPINGIINYAQILVNHAGSGRDLSDLPERIIKEGDRIASIVGSLLSFSHKKQEEVKPVYLHEVLTDALTLMQTQMRKDGIQVKLDLLADLPPIAGRYQQIEQILINLLSNARHALNSKYPEPDELKRLEIIADVAADGMVRLVVQDYGTGMSDELVEKVVNPFFTTKPAGEGTGLGLAITHGIVTDHGGRIEFESHEKEYTRVIIFLPVFSDGASQQAG